MPERFLSFLESLDQYRFKVKPIDIYSTQFYFEHFDLFIYYNKLGSTYPDNVSTLPWGISVWEDQWVNKEHIIKERIRSMLGKNQSIFARKTNIITVSEQVAHHFLEKNHLSGSTKCTYRYALEKDSEIVALATFGPIRHMTKREIPSHSGELIRYCNSGEVTVVGGLSKLLHYFISLHQPDDIMTYADKDWSQGKSYEKLGFRLVAEKASFKFYYDPNKKQRFSEPQLKRLYGKNFMQTIDLSKLILIKHRGSYKFIKELKNGKNK